MSIYIPINLTRTDYDKNLGGWRCPALAIPGAKLSSVRVDSEKKDDDLFPYDSTTGVIRCMVEPVPKTAVAIVELGLELTSVEDAKLELEREKLRVQQVMHQEKLDSERRWKIIAAVAPVVSIIVTALVGQAVRSDDEQPATQTVLRDKVELLNACRSKLRDEDRHLRNNDLNVVEDLRKALAGVIATCQAPTEEALKEAAKS